MMRYYEISTLVVTWIMTRAYFLVLLFILAAAAVRWVWQRRIVKALCGHRTLRSGILQACGEERYVSLMESKPPEFCDACIEERTVLCFNCKRPIFATGEEVMLHPVNLEEISREAYGIYEEGGWSYAVVCMRTSCAKGDPWDGRWTVNGFVKRPEADEGKEESP